MSNRGHHRASDVGFSDPQLWVFVGIASLVVLVLVLVNIPLRIAETLWGSQDLDGNWFVVVFHVLLGKTEWTTGAWLVLGLLVVLLAGVGVIVFLLVRQYQSRSSRLDWLAQYMGWGEEITPLTYDNAQSVAKRLEVYTPMRAPVLDGVEQHSAGLVFHGTGLPRTKVNVGTCESVFGSVMSDRDGLWSVELDGFLPLGTLVFATHVTSGSESLASAAVSVTRGVPMAHRRQLRVVKIDADRELTPPVVDDSEDFEFTHQAIQGCTHLVFSGGECVEREDTVPIPVQHLVKVPVRSGGIS
jgi:hypothetical protein